MVADRSIDANEAVLPDNDAAGNDHVRGDEAVVRDARMMADVVTRPQRRIVADLDERLNGVVLENQAILADLEIRPRRRLRADVRSKRIPFLLCLAAALGADRI